MRSFPGFLVLLLPGLPGCLNELETSEVSQGIISYPETPLQRTWIKSSHNTYESNNTQGTTIAWHFGNTTNQIELDLRDNHQLATFSGDWSIAHGYSAPLTTKCGTGVFDVTLEACLSVISEYHGANPYHPLITVWLDKKQDWEDMDQDTSSRSPWRLDNLIGSYFSAATLLTPMDIWTTGASLRARVISVGWPKHSSTAKGLTGQSKIMFILTSDAGTGGNDRLEQYVDNRGVNAIAFIAPSADSEENVEVLPDGFDAASTGWVAIYNFEWEDSNDDGECDGVPCYYVPNAHALNFLARVWDVDDSEESDTASAGPSRGGIYGEANFIAIDKPWQYGGNGGYGDYPDGTYP